MAPDVYCRLKFVLANWQFVAVHSAYLPTLEKQTNKVD